MEMENGKWKLWHNLTAWPVLACLFPFFLFPLTVQTKSMTTVQKALFCNSVLGGNYPICVFGHVQGDRQAGAGFVKRDTMERKRVAKYERSALAEKTPADGLHVI
ncbi:hypothetical protein IF2G_07771 [Cordyceps javanica]|nr:hypothetical protein IF2G_07771 [Cordyceps javanica]